MRQNLEKRLRRVDSQGQYAFGLSERIFSHNKSGNSAWIPAAGTFPCLLFSGTIARMPCEIVAAPCKHADTATLHARVWLLTPMQVCTPVPARTPLRVRSAVFMILCIFMSIGVVEATATPDQAGVEEIAGASEQSSLPGHAGHSAQFVVDERPDSLKRSTIPRGLTMQEQSQYPDMTTDDRALHIAAGVGTAIFAGGATALVLRPWDTCDGAYFCESRPTWGGAFGVTAVATGASLVAGGAKEVADMLGLGTPSLADMTWTVVGGVTAAVAVSYFVANFAHDSNATTVATGTAASGLVFTIPVQRRLLDRLH